MENAPPVADMPMFPQLATSSHVVMVDIASVILNHLVSKNVIIPESVVDMRKKIAFELRDFVCVVNRIVAQDGERCGREEYMAEMLDEWANVQLKTHHLKTEWMEPCQTVNLSILFHFVTGGLLDSIPNLRGGKYGQNLDYYPHRVRRAMLLDSRLRSLLTQSLDNSLTEEEVVTMMEDIMVARLRKPFADEMQDCSAGHSFDFSKCREFLTDDQMFLLFQLSQYHGVCVYISHLNLNCYCRSKDKLEWQDDAGLENRFKNIKDDGFEFVSWSKYDFPINMAALTGHICEAKQRVVSELDGIVRKKRFLKEAISAGFHSVVEFLKEYANVGWKRVPRTKLIAGMQLEKAYQELARVHALALDGDCLLTVDGVVRQAVKNFEEPFIAYVDIKNGELVGGEEKYRYDRESLWEFIFSVPEGELLRTIMIGEYVQFAFEGYAFSAAIKYKKVEGEQLMKDDTPYGLTVTDSDLTYEELNFLQALCKFFVVKLKIISQDELYSL